MLCSGLHRRCCAKQSSVVGRPLFAVGWILYSRRREPRNGLAIASPANIVEGPDFPAGWHRCLLSGHQKPNQGHIAAVHVRRHGRSCLSKTS